MLGLGMAWTIWQQLLQSLKGNAVLFLPFSQVMEKFHCFSRKMGCEGCSSATAPLGWGKCGEPALGHTEAGAPVTQHLRGSVPPPLTASGLDNVCPLQISRHKHISLLRSIVLLDKALSNLIQLWTSLFFSGQLDQMAFRSPFQLPGFCDSMMADDVLIFYWHYSRLYCANKKWCTPPSKPHGGKIGLGLVPDRLSVGLLV